MKNIKNIIKKSILDNSNLKTGYVALGLGLILLINKISALLKIQILVSIYGVQSKYLDIFHAANVIPELIFSIIVIGGINAALIPIFIQVNNEDNNQELLTNVFSSIVNFFVIVLGLFSIIIFIFAPQIIYFTQKINPISYQGNLNNQDLELLISMIRILIISPIVLCVSSIFSSILQVKNSFWITALAPLFYNIGIIIFSLLSLFLNKNPLIIAIGVVFGSVLHFVIQLPVILRKNVSYKFLRMDMKNTYFQQAIKNTIPRSLGIASEYIAYSIQSFIALNAVTGTLNAFKLALSIREIPYYLIGLSVAQSIFPKLSDFANKKDLVNMQNLISQSIRQVLLWSIPFVCILIILRTPISQLLFGLFKTDGNFQGTNMVSYALLFVSITVILISLIGILNRVYYAFNDVKTPTIITIITVSLEIFLTYFLFNLFSQFENTLINVSNFEQIFKIENYLNYGNSIASVGGLALASSISLFINLIILAYLLRKKGIFIFDKKNLISKKIISGCLTLIFGFLYFKYTNIFFDTTRVIGILFSVVNSTSFIFIIYFILEKIQKDEDIHLIEQGIVKINPALTKIFKNINKIKIIDI